MTFNIDKYIFQKNNPEIINNKKDLYVFFIVHLLFILLNLILFFGFKVYNLIFLILTFCFISFLLFIGILAVKTHCRWLILINLLAWLYDLICSIIQLKWNCVLYDISLLTITLVLFQRIGKTTDKLYHSIILDKIITILSYICGFISVLSYIAFFVLFSYFEWIQLQDNFINMFNPFTHLMSILYMLESPITYIITYITISYFYLTNFLNNNYEDEI